jgi:hypothetical protein
MSGLLRRIKRSRPADAGEPLPEGQAAAPDGAPPTAETPVVAHAPAEPPTVAAPVPVADPAVPAGLDPAETPLRPPAGRRGRLRRRLRYLRRARELMLRDLGGLLYEVHRTAGGRIDAHATLVSAKVDRITALDAEAHALEAALSLPRADAVVFQPGVGGTCATCGELYGSAARFCSNCGATTDPVAVRETPAPTMPPAPPFPAAPGAEAKTSVLAPEAEQRTEPVTWNWGRSAPQAPPAGSPADEPSPPTDQATEPVPDTTPPATEGTPSPTGDTARAPAQDTPPPTDEPASPPADDTQPARTDDDAPPAGGPPAAAPPPDPSRNPFAGVRNGHEEDHTPPGLSSGDPLGSRDARS